MKPTRINAKENLSNPIEEYFADASQSKEVLTSKELFKASPEDVDIKTELDMKEIIPINTMLWNDAYFKSIGLKPIYKNLLNGYFRLKISFERKSRSEFVDMNRAKVNEQGLIDVSKGIGNITGVKK